MLKKTSKTIALVLSILILVLLCGCNMEKAELAIDNHNWTFRYAQNSEGEIIYCNSENKDLYENAEVLDLWNSAKGGVFMISDNNTQDTFAFTYKMNKENEDAFIYDFVYTKDDGNSETGVAVVSTTKENGNIEYTMIVTINGYSIYFYESIK